MLKMGKEFRSSDPVGSENLSLESPGDKSNISVEAAWIGHREVRMRGNNRYSQDRDYEMRSRHRQERTPPNFESARSDYGQRAYGGRLNSEGLDRGWWDRTSDEVSSWFGDDDAERRRRMDERRDRRQDHPQNRQNYRNRESFSERSSREYADRHNLRDMRAGDVMTPNVATVYQDDPVEHAARMMGECDCGAIPVVDWQNRMVGMITDRDIAIRLVGNGVDPMDARVGNCMTKEVFACHVNDRVYDCMRMMSRHKIRRVPVVDSHNRVIGIISQADIAQHAAENSGMGERRALSDVVCSVSEPTSSSYV